MKDFILIAALGGVGFVAWKFYQRSRKGSGNVSAPGFGDTLEDVGCVDCNFQPDREVNDKGQTVWTKEDQEKAVADGNRQKVARVGGSSLFRTPTFRFPSFTPPQPKPEQPASTSTGTRVTGPEPSAAPIPGSGFGSGLGF